LTPETKNFRVLPFCIYMHVERAATEEEDMTSKGVKTQGAMKRRSAGIYGLIISF